MELRPEGHLLCQIGDAPETLLLNGHESYLLQRSGEQPLSWLANLDAERACDVSGSGISGSGFVGEHAEFRLGRDCAGRSICSCSTVNLTGRRGFVL